jgi:hypothetical protein
MTVIRLKKRIEIYELGPVRLFREDLEEIASAVNELGSLNIVCDDTFGANSAEDLAKLPESPRSLKLSASDGDRRIEVDLSVHLSSVTLTEPDTLCHGMLNRIQHVARRPGRRRPPIFTKVLAFLMWALLTMGVLVTTSVFRWQGSPFPVWVDPGIWIAMILICGIMFFQMQKNRDTVICAARIINAYRVDRPSFIRRTRDDWVVESVVAVISLVAGFFLGKYFG